MKPNIEELRKKYMDNPPEGMTSKDIRDMSEDELLDMDYFLNEDDLFADEAGVEGFYTSKQCHHLLMPAFVQAFSFKSSIKIELSYKASKNANLPIGVFGEGISSYGV